MKANEGGYLAHNKGDCTFNADEGENLNSKQTTKRKATMSGVPGTEEQRDTHVYSMMDMTKIDQSQPNMQI